MDSNTLVLLRDFFRSVYQLGDSVTLFNMNGVTVSLNQFLIAFTIMSIILIALLNFAKTHGTESIHNAYDKGYQTGSKNKLKNSYRSDDTFGNPNG